MASMAAAILATARPLGRSGRGYACSSKSLYAVVFDGMFDVLGNAACL